MGIHRLMLLKDYKNYFHDLLIMKLSKKEIESVFFDCCMHYSNHELEKMYREGYLYEDAIGWNNDTTYGDKLSKCADIILKMENKKHITPNEERELKDIFLNQIAEVIAVRKSGSLVFHYADFPLVKRHIRTENNEKYICSQCRNTLSYTDDKDIMKNKIKSFVYSIEVEYALIGTYHLDLCHKCKCVYDDCKEMKKEKEEYRKLVMAINEMTATNSENN